MEFCLNIPDHLYFNNGWKRFIFRETVTGILPKEAQWKKMKDDPAMTRAAANALSKADRLLLALLRLRQEEIQGAHYVNADCLIKDLNESPVLEGVPSRRHMAARQAMWLAFVNMEV